MKTQNEESIRPFEPSWMDRLIHWVADLPGPEWIYYVAAAVVVGLASNAIAWIAGSLPFVNLDAYRLAIGVWFIAVTALIRTTDKIARRSLQQYRPALDVDDRTYARIEYELTTMPARPVWLLTAFGVVIVVAFTVLDPAIQKSLETPLVLAFDLLVNLYALGTGPIGIYHIVRQLVLVSRLHARATRVNLFEPTPLYAFSTLTAATGLILLALNYFSVITDPATFRNPVLFGIVVVMALLAVVCFVFPLWNMHRKIEAEKGRLLLNANRRFETLRAELHTRVDERDYRDADALNKMLASVVLERELVSKLSTWPWQPDLLRGFVSALILPIVLWLIIRVLEQFVVR